MKYSSSDNNATTATVGAGSSSSIDSSINSSSSTTRKISRSTMSWQFWIVMIVVISAFVPLIDDIEFAIVFVQEHGDVSTREMKEKTTTTTTTGTTEILVVDVEDNNRVPEEEEEENVLMVDQQVEEKMHEEVIISINKDEGDESQGIDKESYEEDVDTLSDVFTDAAAVVDAQDGMLEHHKHPIPTFHTPEERMYYFKKMYPLWWEERAQLGHCPHQVIASQQQVSNNTIISSSNNITVYVPTWWDRSGAIIYRLITTYAYCIKHGFQFGGGIPRTEDIDWQRKKLIHEDLINAIGLQDILQFHLPNRNNEREFENSYNLAWEYCIKDKEWNIMNTTILEIIRSKQRFQQQPSPANAADDSSALASSSSSRQMASTTNELSDTAATTSSGVDSNADNTTAQKEKKIVVAIHIRRGDAQPCTDLIFKERYHPNAFYQDVLDRYIFDKDSSFRLNNNINNDITNDDDIEVIIYSESDSYESWDEFRELGYKLNLDGNTKDAWIGMMNANALIISPNSYFSYVPGLLNRKAHEHIYTTSREYKKLYHWIHIDPNIVKHNNKILNNEIATIPKCKLWLKHNPIHQAKHTVWRTRTRKSRRRSRE